jgi:CRP-like cAMP-binding protein
MFHDSPGPGRNALLASLPPADSASLISVSRIEYPSPGHVLTYGSEVTTDVWFPHAGAIALITTDVSGRSVQTGLVGREGCVGLEALFGTRRPVPDAVVQIGGAMLVVPAAHLRTAFEARPDIQVALSRFLYGLWMQSVRTIACNRLHTMLSRCCRWLLTMQDKTKSENLPVTQESLATLLGGGRPRVNLLLAALERDGILRRGRGRIHVTMRTGLERNTCECYYRVRDAYGLLYNDYS